jgi:hypothetical protein
MVHHKANLLIVVAQEVQVEVAPALVVEEHKLLMLVLVPLAKEKMAGMVGIKIPQMAAAVAAVQIPLVAMLLQTEGAMVAADYNGLMEQHMLAAVVEVLIVEQHRQEVLVVVEMVAQEPAAAAQLEEQTLVAAEEDPI